MAPSCQITSEVGSTPSTASTCPREISMARSCVSVGVVEATATGADWATSVLRTSPLAPVTTTKSPPMTGRPWWSRS